MSHQPTTVAVPCGTALQHATPRALRAGQRVFMRISLGGVPRLAPATVAWRDGGACGRAACTTVRVPFYASEVDLGDVDLDDAEARRLLVLCNRAGEPLEGRA